MPLLEAFLALALTMLSLAMIATLGVEFLNRVAGTRAKGLKNLLEEFYDSELGPRIKSELNKSEEQVQAAKTALVKRLLTNPLVKDKDTAKFLEKNLADLESLSTENLLKRLANTDLGQKIKTKSEQEIDEFVDSIARSYEAFGVASSEMFRRKARIISSLAGIVVAIGLNVNAIMVFQMYLDDPNVRTQAVAQADAIVKRYEKSLDEAAGGDAAAGDTTNLPPGFESLDDVRQQIAAMKNDIKELDNLGIKVGWTAGKAPVTVWNDSKPEDASTASGGRTFGRMLASWRFWEWFLGIIGTGFLIGLGGPFWFDVVRKLSDLLQVVKGGKPSAPPETAESVPTQPADPMQPLKETFKRTGELPVCVKAREQFTMLSKITEATDQRVNSAAEALKRTMEAAGDQPDETLQNTINAAKDSLEAAVGVQKANYQAKHEAAMRFLKPDV